MIAGRYILGASIGFGAAATVYRAWDPASNTAVAVKLFHDSADPHALNRQRRELRAMAHLGHPGLVRIHGGGVDGGRLYVVSELVEGLTVADRLLRAPLGEAEVRRVGAQLAGGLAHLHARGVVHRDVKPSNILLTEDEQPDARLLDFGIARVLGYTALTETGCVLGTAAYLSPEQVRGEAVGPPTDVYALGLVLIEAVTGRRVYSGTLVESAVARLYRPPRVPDGLSAGLTGLLERMTSPVPGDRPAASELVTLPGVAG